MQELTTFIAHHQWLTLATASVFILLVIVELIRAKKNTFNINPAEVTQLINKKNAVVIDTRSDDAYRKGHIIDSQAITVDEIEKNSKKIEKLKNRPVIIVSHTHSESQKIAVSLLKQGYNAFSLSGGIKAWNEAQMPLVKG